MQRLTWLLGAAVLGLVGTAGCTTEGRGAATAEGFTSAVRTTSAPADVSETEQPNDVQLIDDAVRNLHADAFTVVPERLWAKRVAAVAEAFPTSEGDERAMLLARLAGLLDTHTQFFGAPELMYDVWFYRFADGMHVVAARDASLIGARLISIAGTPAQRVEQLMNTTIPADNPSANLNAAYLTAYVDHLHGLDIVTDPDRPQFTFALPDGHRRTVNLGVSTAEELTGALGIMGSAAGDFTEAVRRRGEGLWWRSDRRSRTFLLSVNDYLDPSQAIDAMHAALDSRRVDRVVIDLRYLRGGDYTPLLPLIQAVSEDDRVDRPGGLAVLIGRENESAATVLAYKLDIETRATLIGEPTPARADNFLCPCQDVDLPITGYVFSVPTSRAGNGDPRPAVMPDQRVAPRAADYFAGRDVALERALRG